MQTRYQELKNRLMEIDDLNAAAALLHWDQATYMPPGGSAARGRQIATLTRLAHEKFTAPAIGKLLESLRPYEADLPYASNEASLIRVARREFERALKVPPEFTSRFSTHSAAAYDAWAKARPANDFAAIQPYLEKTLELSREQANYFPGYEHIADPLIEDADYGMKVSTLQALFTELRAHLVPLVEAIQDQPPADDSCLKQSYPVEKQMDFAREIIQQLGYDFEGGRQDPTHHPFMIKFSLGDVRVTTRSKEDDLSEALFSAIHEAGHAIYEQGIHKDLEGTLLANGTSSGVHESQSRLWENQIGRSYDFWTHYYPGLQRVFPDQLGAIPMDAFYRAINKVARSLIRTDADEVTYNLHVIVRFDLELALLEGKLAVRDLPAAWRARYQTDLGIQPPDDRDGVLQDVHWYVGQIGGMFQGYTLGNLLSAQFFEAAVQAHPGIKTEIQRGHFATLHQWLKENIYQHGSKFTTNELVEQITGGPIRIDPYIQYLRTKYGGLYPL